MQGRPYQVLTLGVFRNLFAVSMIEDIFPDMLQTTIIQDTKFRIFYYVADPAYSMSDGPPTISKLRKT